jgi:hypothetical protein
MGDMPIIWLVGSLRFEPRVALSRNGIVRQYSGAYVNSPRPRLVGVWAVPRLCIILYPGIFLTTEENHGPHSGHPESVRLISAGTIRSFDLAMIERWSGWPAGLRRS